MQTLNLLAISQGPDSFQFRSCSQFLSFFISEISLKPLIRIRAQSPCYALVSMLPQVCNVWHTTVCN